MGARNDDTSGSRSAAAGAPRPLDGPAPAGTPGPLAGPGPGATAPEPPTWAVIAGGGTAGHVNPGLAVAQALVARGHQAATIHWVGTNRGIEARLVPPAGFGLTLLPGRGAQRRLTPANLGAAWAFLRATLMALRLVAARRPAVVVVLGGYASLPCALAALVFRVPVVVQEQNAVPGAVNRLVARFARASAVPMARCGLPRSVVTGNPVRAEIAELARHLDGHAAEPTGKSRASRSARAALGLPQDRRVVAVFGGSLGARRINLAVRSARAQWSGRADLALHHVVGERDWELVADPAPSPATADGPAALLYQPVRYEDRMDLVLAAADVAVCRAGATTVAELAVAGLPAVLVPLPGAPGDHQTANARWLADAGAAVIVPDRELDGRRLVEEVERLIADPDRLAALGAAAAAAGRPDAARRVAEVVEIHARDPR
ncbi:MAG: undecaprenyldiphospho-muramoylpentapeptide beta-N-acetylglucosaminyltransferase [Acidimicrobiales bacterium]